MAHEQSQAPDAPGDAESTPAATPEQVQESLDTLRRGAADAFSRLAASAENLAVRARELRLANTRSVRAHPVGWMGGAFALGVFVGVLFDRA